MPDEAQREGDEILHEDAVQDVVDKEVAKDVQPDAVTIADLVVNVGVAAGSAPTKAEHDALVAACNANAVKVNSLLAVLRGIDVIAGA